MFKSIFSFKGRIKRAEYAITFVSYWTLYIILRVLIAQDSSYGILGLLIVPMLYILWAQGAKRCHDINQNGWWQIVPFYFFVLLSRESDHWANQYDIEGTERFYGAEDYEKPFVIDQDINPITTPILNKVTDIHSDVQ